MPAAEIVGYFGLAPAAWAMVAVAASVILLTVMIAFGKIPPLLSFIVAAIVAGLMLGLPLTTLSKTVEKGIGDLVGSLTAVICLGAIFGKLVADSGAAQKIAATLIRLAGNKAMPLALAATGFIVGIPLYYNVGFVLMIPLIFSLVYQSKRPAVALAIPLLCGLSTAHGFLPPHPSPTALVAQFHADLGLTLLYGLAVAIPSLLIAGPLFAMSLKKIEAKPAEVFLAPPRDESELPGAFNSFFTALLPVILLAGATGVNLAVGRESPLAPAIAVLADPTVVMLIALGAATVTLGIGRGQSLPTVMKSAEQALRDVAPILLIIAGAGALKQVFIDSGVSKQLGEQMAQIPVHPLVLGWLIATVIRIALGSATVAGITAAGVVAPVVVATGVDPNLMVLSVGAGSLMCSHVNDSGFWMFKEYFNLDLKQTFRSWSLMETIVGVCGLVFVLGLNNILGH
ncbi:MAG: gluconate transporter [Asticcacaulis sp.]|nr:gluconate transporter [Asticcacaulis sp.]